MENVSVLSLFSLPDRLFTLHDYASGMAVCQAARQAGVPFWQQGKAAFGFISAPGAAGYLGVVWWQTLIKTIERQANCRFPHILDCDRNAGYAMMAAMHEQRLIVLHNDSPGTQAVRALYTQRGGHVFITRPPSFDLIAPLSDATHLAAHFSQSYCKNSEPAT
ncbi:hypothetical protein ACI01nite_17890 [Acetobacter cibinongensis]|uniref:Uncharacterized protein n=1 Tax=Acetobacter cibinongensis TaxID=146475 RepID=A0A0D6N140_9PROT|nr:hypothetical protein [Acetobacter cibinongensis]GAN59664.1 hypothetical protein Abci_007_067 [Acetobacter cibinongensis]GEL59187.1 hypothetical protein ACI01nite_17890 [Acetobacter cibinongensis]